MFEGAGARAGLVAFGGTGVRAGVGALSALLDKLGIFEGAGASKLLKAHPDEPSWLDLQSHLH